MQCFYHTGVAAVGTCKSCGKGLCPHCAVDLGKGLACRGRCEKDVTALIGLIESNIERSPIHNQLIDNARKNRFISPVFQIVLGLFFVGLASYQLMSQGFQASDLILWGMGTFFLIFGLISLSRAIRLTAPKK